MSDSVRTITARVNTSRSTASEAGVEGLGWRRRRFVWPISSNNQAEERTGGPALDIFATAWNGNMNVCVLENTPEEQAEVVSRTGPRSKQLQSHHSDM